MRQVITDTVTSCDVCRLSLEVKSLPVPIGPAFEGSSLDVCWECFSKAARKAAHSEWDKTSSLLYPKKTNLNPNLGSETVGIVFHEAVNSCKNYKELNQVKRSLGLLPEVKEEKRVNGKRVAPKGLS